MRKHLRGLCLLNFAAVQCFAANTLSSADEQAPSIDPEVIHELLDTAGRLIRSSYGTCPYLGVRVRPDPVPDVSLFGYVPVVFDVSVDGTAINTEIHESSVGKDQQETALEIIKLFTFRPLIREHTVHIFENWVERIVSFPRASNRTTLGPARKATWKVAAHSSLSLCFCRLRQL